MFTLGTNCHCSIAGSTLQTKSACHHLHRTRDSLHLSSLFSPLFPPLCPLLSTLSPLLSRLCCLLSASAHMASSIIKTCRQPPPLPQRHHIYALLHNLPVIDMIKRLMKLKVRQWNYMCVGRAHVHAQPRMRLNWYFSVINTYMIFMCFDM